MGSSSGQQSKQTKLTRLARHSRNRHTPYRLAFINGILCDAATTRATRRLIERLFGNRRLCRWLQNSTLLQDDVESQIARRFGLHDATLHIIAMAILWFKQRQAQPVQPLGLPEQMQSGPAPATAEAGLPPPARLPLGMAAEPLLPPAAPLPGVSTSGQGGAVEEAALQAESPLPPRGLWPGLAPPLQPTGSAPRLARRQLRPVRPQSGFQTPSPPPPGGDNQLAGFLQHLASFVSILVLSIGVAVGVSAGVWALLKFFEANMHVAVLQAMWHQGDTSLKRAASMEAESHMDTLKRELKQAEKDDTRLVLFAHSHGGMVAQMLIEMLHQQPWFEGLQAHLIVIGMGNPNIIPDGQVRVYQYGTTRDPVVEIFEPFADWGVAKTFSDELESQVQVRMQLPQQFALHPKWHEADVYLNLFLLDS